MKRPNRHFTSSQIIILGFAAAILLGSLLLMLPVSTRDGQGASFWDALFTSTSAVCVTGLVVRDTATYWSLFGQAVILTLIQIGGMGVVTLAVAITIISGRRIGLKQRSTMQEAISAPKVGGIVRLTGFIIRMTVLFELAGAAVMAPVFIGEFGPAKGLWYSVFHAISAFCNAGFDLMGVRSPFSSLTSFAANPVINIAVMLLIIIGGIGFTAWDDIRANGLHVHRYRMQSKVVLTSTLLLIALPALYFAFFEFGGLPAGERLLVSLFQAVTPRTAGFSTVDTASLSGAGTVLTQTLMAIGAGSGSTGGGIKVSTFAVMALAVLSHMRGHKDVQIWGERVDAPLVRSAFCNTLLFLGMALAGTFLVLAFQPLPLTDAAFECLSAIGTVGMSTGVTASLETGPKLVLILLMYAGRVGSITVFLAFIRPRRSGKTRCPVGKVVIG